MNARISQFGLTMVVVALTALALPASASTVLTFQSPLNVFHLNDSIVNYPQTNDPSLPVYGDHVSASTNTIGTPNSYLYGGGAGFTPDVGVSYGPGDPNHTIRAIPVPPTPSTNPFPAYGAGASAPFGNLLSPIYQVDFPNTVADLTLSITLTADPGHVVKLEGFDLAAYDQAGLLHNLDSLEVIVNGSPIVLGTNISVSQTTRNTYDFTASPYIGSTVEILMDGRDTFPYVSDAKAIESFTDIGIDNITFSEGTPEPASMALLAGGSLLLLRRRRA